MQTRTVLGVIAVVMIVGATGPASAGSLAPTKPSNLVTVELNSSPVGGCGGFSNELFFDTRVLRDGTTAPFAVPSGQSLIVTSVSVRYSHGGATMVQWHLAIGDTTIATPIASAVLDLGPGSTSFASGSVVFPNGVAIGPGKSLCTSTGQTGGILGTIFAVAHGYLVKDR